MILILLLRAWKFAHVSRLQRYLSVDNVFVEKKFVIVINTVRAVDGGVVAVFRYPLRARHYRARFDREKYEIQLRCIIVPYCEN